MIHFVHRKDTWVRVHNNCLKIKTPTSVHLAACVCVCVCVFWYHLIFTLLYASNSIQNASEQIVSRIHLFLINFTLHSSPQRKI